MQGARISVITAARVSDAHSPLRSSASPAPDILHILPQATTYPMSAPLGFG